ncbi:hypothetical protein O1L60_39340 [Streptomyces diastatochromogenes]|nr:hypothetical protein [Streptomyces diastatochromogenes]MCZ0982948.1 hypothetical protein [Streptomyces diastatochromogenes]
MRLIWTNNRDDQDGVTLTGTGYSEPIDLMEAESLFFSVVVGDPPDDIERHDSSDPGAHLILRLGVSDAGGTWLYVASLSPRKRETHGSPWILDEPPHDYVSLGLSLSSDGKHAIPMVLPPIAVIRWDAHRVAPGFRFQPASFGKTVISLYGR